MIYVITTSSHTYTHPRRECGDLVQLMTYDYVFSRHFLLLGTWIFTDLDRLGFWELELAAKVYMELKAAGVRVLNNPARICQRFSLLRRLKNKGLNSYSVWRVEDDEMPDRYPVFLRTQSAHRGVLDELIYDAETLKDEIDKACNQGYPTKEIMIVEYCARPTDTGIFRKLAAYRIGDNIVPAICAHQKHWVAKYGDKGIAGQALYDEEYRLIKDNPYADEILNIFNIGHIEYGRIDFGLVENKIETYEINTNPYVFFTRKHPYPIRIESGNLSKKLYEDAMAEINTPDTNQKIEIISVRSAFKDLINSPPFTQHRRIP